MRARTRNIFLQESAYLKIVRLRRKRKRNSTSVLYLEREIDGEFHTLYQKLRNCPNLFHGYTRILPQTFDYILKAITPALQYKPTYFQQLMSVQERLIVTLRYLATGIQFRTLAYSFRISKSAVAVIVKEVCKAIWNTLVKIHMPESTTTQFEKSATDFWKRWQFRNCISCIDGKHVRINRPKKSSSMYYNYKNFFSIGLLALTDSNYKFIMVEVGSYGKESDGGLFENSALRRAIESKKLALPNETTLPGLRITAPFVFLADAAFPLTGYLMRPFPREKLQEGDENGTFNYRLSRARMVVECSFGHVVTKFRLLGKAIETKVENAVHIVKAITILHNIIIDREGTAEVDVIRDMAIDPRICIRPTKHNNAACQKAIFTRRKFSRFFTLRPVVRA